METENTKIAPLKVWVYNEETKQFGWIDLAEAMMLFHNELIDVLVEKIERRLKIDLNENNEKA